MPKWPGAMRVYAPMLRRYRFKLLQGIYGCGAHSDYGVMTLLATDGTPGLQIK